MSTVRDVLSEAYRAFNDRDIDRALEAVHPEVDWANGMEGGYVCGRQAVREYWTRQWRQIDPHVEPHRFTTDDAGRTVVDVRQVVRDPEGPVRAFSEETLPSLWHQTHQRETGLDSRIRRRHRRIKSDR